MASISSLLKSASSTRKKILAQEDAVVAFNWENSAQTYNDFVDYSRYLDDRAATADITSQLSYETKKRSARRSYTSNELQRQQISILQGTGTTQNKLDAMVDLYYQAVDNDDFNLAQNLMQQYSSLSITLQNEQAAAVKSFQAAGKKAADNLLKDITGGSEDITLPTGQTITPLAALTRHFKETGDTVGTIAAAEETLEALRDIIIDQYQNAKTQEDIDKLEKDYGAGLQDINEKLFIKMPGAPDGKLNFQDVVNAKAQDSFNNPAYGLQASYNEATGETEFKLKTNNVERLDYVRQTDEQGQEYYAPLAVRTDQDKVRFGESDQGRGLGTLITDEGFIVGGEIGNTNTGEVSRGTSKVERDDSQSIGNRLKRFGIGARQSGTTLMIKLPGQNVERMATIQPDGSIRYMDDDGQLSELGLIDRNLGTEAAPVIAKAGQQRVVNPEELSDFGTQSAFGGTLSQASGAGIRQLADITGQSPMQNVAGPLSGQINIGNDFSGFGTSVTSGLLQGAGAVRKQIEQEQQRQAMLQAQAQATARLQASQTFNLNQTPVRQLTSDGLRVNQLRVAAPAPTPRVYVAPPQQAQKIGSVGVARPKGKVTVSAPSRRPRLVVR